MNTNGKTIEEIDFEIKCIELKEKQLMFEKNIEFRFAEKLHNQNLSLLQELRSLLTSTKIDESKSFVGGESVYKNLLTEEEEYIVKQKILKILSTL